MSGVSFPLSIRPVAGLAQKPAAWLVPGASCEAWVAELAGWGVALKAFEDFLLDLAGGDARKVESDAAEELLAPQVYWSTRASRAVRHRFDAAFADSLARLSLVTGKNEVFQIDRNEAGEPILKELGRRRHASPKVQWFAPAAPPAGMKVDLKTTNWPDGSRAFLDSRGMLHLKSSDRTLPELSLVLGREKLAGWSSDGRVFGPPAFLGDAEPSPPGELWKLIESFVVRLQP